MGSIFPVHFLLLVVFIDSILLSTAQNTTVTFPQQGIGPCTCDLTPQTCDIGCCCDADCTAADIQAFIKSCKAFTFDNVKKCLPNYLFFRYTAPDKVNTTDPNQICFYQDSFTSRNNYTAPDIVSNETDAQQIISIHLGFAMPVYRYLLTNVQNLGSYYVSNRPIYIFFPSNTYGQLTLPSVQSSTACGTDIPIKYLVDQSVTCQRSVSPLSTQCESAGFLRAENYVSKFKIVQSPSVFRSELNQTTTDTEVISPVPYNATGMLTIDTSVSCFGSDECNTSVIVPSYNATSGECTNALKSLVYDIIYDGIAGISSVTAKIQLGTLKAATGTSFSQTLAVNFKSINGTAGAARSGNPGYLVDKPVLAGTLDNKTNTITVSSSPQSQLTIVSGGSCSETGSRTWVPFGISMMSGCTISIMKNISTECSALDATIKKSLLGSSFPNRIATFGNSLVSKPDDWISIITVGDTTVPNNFPSGCSQIVVGAQLTIITSRVGSVTNPQSRIIGAQWKYVRGDIKFKCSEPTCATTTSQPFPISMAVNFADSSVTGGPQESTDPLARSRFDNDFFYAFKVEDLSDL